MTRNAPLLPIFLIVVVDVLGLTLIIPLLPFYAERYGATPLQVGWLATSYALCQLISGPILGRMSDRVGRRPLLLLSQIGTLVGFVMLANAKTLTVVFLSRVIDGATAGNLSLAQAYISDVTEPHERAKSFAIIGIAFGIGFLVGPAISGFLSNYGYHYPIYAAAVLSATSIGLTYFLLPKGFKKPTEKSESPLFNIAGYFKYFSHPRLSDLLLQFFCFAIAFSFFVSGFALFAERRLLWDGRPYGPREVGYLFAFSGLIGMLIQGGLIGPLVKRYAEAKLALAGFFLMSAGYLILGFAYSLPVLLLSASISAFGHGFLRPSLMSLISQEAGVDEQGAVLGVSQSLQSVSQIIAPTIAGFLIGIGWLGQWAWCASAVTLVGFWLALRRNRRFTVMGSV